MNPALPRSPAGDYNPWMIAAIVSLAPFMEILDTTIANVSLTHIAGSLGASASESTWVLTSYLVSNSIILPISGWLSQVIGRKLFYQICVALFTVSSVMCAFSTSLDMIIVARVLQGLGGGGLAPVTQSMLADSAVPERRAGMFALFGVSIMVAPAVGPVLGGWLTDNLSWHWIFLINLPVGLIAFTLIAIFISEPPLLVQERQELIARGIRMDYFGLFLVSAGFGSLQMVFDKFELDDGFSSPFVVLMAAVALVSLSTLVVWEWGHEQPVMNFRLFKVRNFSICAALMLLNGFIFMSSTQLLPQLAQAVLGYDSQTAGMSLALGGVAIMPLVPLAGFLTGRIVQPRFLICMAFIEIGLSLLWQSELPPDVNFNLLSVARVSQVILLPFVWVPLSASAYIGIPPRNNGEASALINQMRNIGGGVGISFVTSLLAWRTQFHHARLAEAITPYGSLHGMTLSAIAPIVQQQASFVSYLDVFHTVGLIALAVWPMALFLQPPPKRAA
jgi:DHA2 family multidrug resistance protein